MASTYVNDLRLNELGTGDGSGTWGTTTNTNLELIAEGLSFGTEAITTNADTHTSTVADGATDPARSIYIKYTGTLDSACTITIAPNTLSRLHFIENGTSGSQNIIISQGSGANVTIPPGDVKVVYLDGAGSGAAVVDAFASLSVVDLKVQDDLTVTDDLIVNGDIDLEGSIDVNGTANLDVVDIDGAVDMASTLQVDGAITSSSGATITTAGNTAQLKLESTDADANVGPILEMTRNSSSPADNDILARIDFKGDNDAAEETFFGSINAVATDVSDGAEDAQIKHRVMVNGTVTSMLDLDASGATFGGNIVMPDNAKALFGASSDLQIYHDGSHSYIDDAGTGDLIIRASDDLHIQKYTGETMINCNVDGSVDLYHNNVNKLQTTSTGVDITGGFTATDGCTITTADNDPQLTLVSTDADANEGPILKFHRNSASPADNDLIGQLLFHGEDGAGNDQQYANIQSIIMNNAQGNEDGRLTFRTLKAGTATSRLDISNAETVFNDSSVDVDFRVESDNTTHALFVEGSSGNVGIGDSDPGRMLHIKALGTGTAEQASLLMENEIGTTGEVKQGPSSANALIFTENGTEAARITTSQNFYLGTQTGFSQGERLSISYPHLSGTGIVIDSGSDGGAAMRFRTNSSLVGSIITTTSSTAFNTSSDYRLKESISYDFDATTRLKKLKPCRFNFIADADTTVDGFLAHEVSSIVPESVTGTKDETRSVSNAVLSSTGELLAEGITQDEWTAAKDDTYPSDSTWTASHTEPVMQGIDQSKLVPLLVKTIQELEARITALEAG